MTVLLNHEMFTGPQCWRLVDNLLNQQGVTSHLISLHPEAVTKCGRDFASVSATVATQICQLVVDGHSLAALLVEKLLPVYPDALPILVNPSPGWGSLSYCWYSLSSHCRFSSLCQSAILVGNDFCASGIHEEAVVFTDQKYR